MELVGSLYPTTISSKQVKTCYMPILGLPTITWPDSLKNHFLNRQQILYTTLELARDCGQRSVLYWYIGVFHILIQHQQQLCLNSIYMAGLTNKTYNIKYIIDSNFNR